MTRSAIVSIGYNKSRKPKRPENHDPLEEKVFQISKISPDQDRPLVIASCGKTAAERLLAALATQEDGAQYRVTAIFINPLLPGLE
jgi:hypothetical protein